MTHKEHLTLFSTDKSIRVFWSCKYTVYTAIPSHIGDIEKI